MASHMSTRPQPEAAHVLLARIGPLNPALLSAGVACGVYLLTIAPTVFSLDSAELTVAAYSLGLTHAPGYPAYLLLLHLFLMLPIGDVGFRANLFSALAGSLGVGLIAVVGRRVVGRWLPACVAALCFAFSAPIWSVALVAEVYAFQGALLAMVLLLLLAWRQEGRPGALAGAAGLLGLAVATPRWRGLRPRQLAAALAAAALGMSVILYLPLRSLARPDFVAVGAFDTQAVFHPANLADLVTLRDYLLGQQFAGLFFSDLPAFWRQLGGLLAQLALGFLGVGLPLGIWGGLALWRRDRGLTAGLALTALPHALFFVSYGAPDKALMFLPVYLIWAVFLSVGLQALSDEFARMSPALLLLLPLALACMNAPVVNMRAATGPAALASQRLQAAPPQTLYLATWGDAGLMRYYQVVEGLRADVLVVNRFFVAPGQLAPLIDDALRSRPVVATFQDLSLADRFSMAPAGGGYRIMLRPQHWKQPRMLAQ